MGRVITVIVALAATTGPLHNVQKTHELPTPAATQHADGSTSPAQAIRRFAQRYINWNAGDVAARMRALARASVGQARSEMALTAAQVSADRTLKRAGIANHGTIEAIAALKGQPQRYVVVTRERTTATYTTAYQGLAPAWHVTVAKVVRVTTGRKGVGRGGHKGQPRPRWAVSVWQPEG